jgi:hypothetical protein
MITDEEICKAVRDRYIDGKEWNEHTMEFIRSMLEWMSEKHPNEFWEAIAPWR